MSPGIPDSYQKLPESDSGSFRYTRSHEYQTFTRHALLGHRKRTLTSSTIDLSRLPPTKACLGSTQPELTIKQKSGRPPISPFLRCQLISWCINWRTWRFWWWWRWHQPSYCHHHQSRRVLQNLQPGCQPERLGGSRHHDTTGALHYPSNHGPPFGHVRNGDIGGLPDFCLIVRTKCKMLIFCIVLIFALTFVTFDRCRLYRWYKLTFETFYVHEIVSDIAIFVLKRDVKLQLTN